MSKRDYRDCAIAMLVCLLIAGFCVAVLSGCFTRDEAQAQPADKQEVPLTWKMDGEKQLCVNENGSWYQITGLYEREVGPLVLFCAVAKDGSPVVVVLRRGVNDKPAPFRFEYKNGSPILQHYASSHGDEFYVAKGPFREGPEKVIEKIN